MQAENSNITAGILIIGDEILSGRTQDTNTNYIAKALNEKGIRLKEVLVIPDDVSLIAEKVREYSNRFHYVFTTGGIGPTHDDKTAEAVAMAFNTKLELNQDARNILLEHYGEDQLNPAREKMAWLPVGAEMIPNSATAAPGILIKNVFVLAGIPDIMAAMLKTILPNLKSGAIVHSVTISCNLPESVLAPDLEVFQNEVENVDIGSYPRYKDGVAGLSVVVRSTDVDAMHDVEKKIKASVKQYEEQHVA